MNKVLRFYVVFGQHYPSRAERELETEPPQRYTFRSGTEEVRKRNRIGGWGQEVNADASDRAAPPSSHSRPASKSSGSQVKKNASKRFVTKHQQTV